MVKNQNKLLLGLCLLFFLSVTTQAQDWVSWSMVKLNYQLNTRMEMVGNVEYRTKEHISVSDRIGVNVGAKYTFPLSFQLEGAYEVHYRNRGEEGWRFRHRYYIGLQYAWMWNHLKLSWRERFQETFFEGEKELRLRSRLKMKYAPAEWVVNPYFSVELYQPIGDSDFFSVARMRYRPGVEWKISELCSLDLFYCRQYETAASKNILGFELGFYF